MNTDINKKTAKLVLDGAVDIVKGYIGKLCSAENVWGNVWANCEVFHKSEYDSESKKFGTVKDCDIENGCIEVKICDNYDLSFWGHCLANGKKPKAITIEVKRIPEYLKNGTLSFKRPRRLFGR